jgi:hypothetical protein
MKVRRTALLATRILFVVASLNACAMGPDPRTETVMSEGSASVSAVDHQQATGPAEAPESSAAGRCYCVTRCNEPEQLFFANGYASEFRACRASLADCDATCPSSSYCEYWERDCV